MAHMKATIPLIVITGPTASGKSGLAMRLAQKWNGEIICADSRTVYKGLDIGTAKPSLADQALVPHWLLDVVAPGERFTVADFQRLARSAITDIRSRGKVPFLVGGTGLYIDAVVLDFSFGLDVDMSYRQQLEKLSVEQLKTMIIQQQMHMPENKNNKRHLVRCIEKNNATVSGKKVPDRSTYVIAIHTEEKELRTRMKNRADEMFVMGVLQETQQMFEKYPLDVEALSGNIYPIVRAMLDGVMDQSEAKRQFVTKDWRLAKRQLTWIRRHNYVHWLNLRDAEIFIDTQLGQSYLVTPGYFSGTIEDERKG